MAQVRVKAITVDKNQATLYLDDGKGTTLQINQGDHRLASILELAMPIIKRGEVAVIDIENPESVFSDYQKKSNGFIRFFKAAKEAVKDFFMGGRDDYSNKPVEEPKKPVMAVEPTVFEESAKPTPQVDTGMYAPVEDVEEVKKPDLTVKEAVDDTLSHNETLVAVLEDGTTIPGVEKLRSHFFHAKDADQVKGLNALMARLGKMIDKRAHSVEDILKFMERGDMPVTVDGDIIGYKVLSRSSWGGNKIEGFFFDPHTKRVKQRVGSFVNVAEELVDKNRKNECSNGLHVARHGYLQGFQSDEVFMILVAPEDIITVPHGDANKVRTMGYHIVAHLPQEAYRLIKDHKPITSIPAMKELLANVIKGNHIPRLESVRINGHLGTNLEITPLGSREDRLKWKFESNVTEAEVKKAEAVRNIEKTAQQYAEDSKPVDIRDLNKKLQEPVKPVDPVARIIETKDRVAAQELVDRKRKQKKSWEKMGVAPSYVQPLLDLVAVQEAVEQIPAEVRDLTVVTEPQIVDEVPKAPEIKQDEAKVTTYDTSRMSGDVSYWFSTKNWEAIRALKMKRKKSYAALGFGPEELKMLIDGLERIDNVVAEPEKEEPKTEEAVPVSAPVVEIPAQDQKADEFFPIATMEEFRTVLESFVLKPNQKNYTRLVQFKKAKKKSWSALTDNPAYNAIIDSFANGK